MFITAKKRLFAESLRLRIRDLEVGILDRGFKGGDFGVGTGEWGGGGVRLAVGCGLSGEWAKSCVQVGGRFRSSVHFEKLLNVTALRRKKIH